MTRNEVISKVNMILDSNPVFLDTETTGLLSSAQVVEIAILDTDGRVLLNTLVRPTVPVSDEARRLHGICDDDLEDAPAFLTIVNDIRDLLSPGNCVIYNAAFYLRILRQSADAYQASRRACDSLTAECAMRLYTGFRQDGGKWQNMHTAASECGIRVPENLHSAALDAHLTRMIMLHMAGTRLC